MRQLSFVSFAAASATAFALVCFSGNAFAAPGKEGTRQAATPTSSSSTDSSDSGNSTTDERTTGTRLQPLGAASGNPDIVNNDRVQQKAWEIGGGFEAHHLLAQEDVEGSAQYKQFNILGFYGQYDLSQYDRVRVSGFVYEYFLADSGETGFRFDDILLRYTRRIPLPSQITLRVSPSLSIPTSYDSQRQSNITTAHLSVQLDKKFGRYTDIALNGGSTYIVDHYAESENGGVANARASVSFGASASVVMPFHENLSIGTDFGTGYTWFYQPNTTGDANPAVQANGTVGDSQFNSQPITQSYFGEVYVQYTMPTIFGIRSDILVAYADGDPTIGNVSVLHDGVGHFYGYYRYNSEVYAALSAAY